MGEMVCYTPLCPYCGRVPPSSRRHSTRTRHQHFVWQRKVYTSIWYSFILVYCSFKTLFILLNLTINKLSNVQDSKRKFKRFMSPFVFKCTRVTFSAANISLLSIFATFPRYYLQESRMFCLLTMKDDENVHPVKLILCQCEKIIKLILCLIFHLLPWRITEISLRKTKITIFYIFWV